MEFPKRITQHKEESDSLAILLYKLKDLGIFRNYTNNDYGIDLEIEITNGEKVIGKYFKAQVKSSNKLNFRKDGVPTVGRIKQTTLNYWAELSFHSHVLGFAVDLKSENIYITRPLFWKAISLINEDKKTKTIEFISKEETPTDKYKLINFLKELINYPSVFEQINAHKKFLLIFLKIIDSYKDCVESDFGSEITVGNDDFIVFLETSKILLHDIELEPSKEIKLVEDEIQKNEYSHFNLARKFTASDIINIFDFEHYNRLSNHCFPDINAKDAMVAYFVLFPKIGKKLQYLRKIILNSKSFWLRRDLYYLKLTFINELPEKFNYTSLLEFEKKQKCIDYDLIEEHFEKFIMT